jgi:5-(carboxyamino)imidazole ribonucleotide synthase
VAEAGMSFYAEFSVILARAANGDSRAFPLTHNEHDGGILRISTVPAGPAIDALTDSAIVAARAIAEALGHVGVLTVEFFACADGPVVNEIAPRVHNSGHWTLEGAKTSQFEQHLRAILGLPLGDLGLVATGATMENLIGADVERWADFIAEPGAALHLYNKGEARPGRKMGHVTRLG